MFHIKKSILTTIFTFFTFSHISALNMQDSNISNYTTQEINGGTYRSYIDEDREVYVQHWQELDSNNFMRYETPIDISHSPDLNNNHDSQSNQYNSETPDQSQSSQSQQHDHIEDWLKDNIRDSFVEQMESNRTQQNNAQCDGNHANTLQRQLFKQALDKTNNSYDLANKLLLPTVKEYLQQIRDNTATQFARKHKRFLDRKKTFPIEEAELKFIDLLISGKIAELLQQIHDPSLSVAKKAFAKLKELWPWQRNHTFLTDSFVNGTSENSFITHLGIDIMKIAEGDLISRPDYVAQHTNPESFKIIQEFKEKCTTLQQKGNQRELSQEHLNWHDKVHKNRKNDDFTSNVCYAIAQKIHSDPITNVLYEIAHTQSLEKAHNQLQYLEMQILDQAQQHNIVLTDQIKDFAIKQYGFDPIEAAYSCYTSRPDYIKTINDQPILSNNNIFPILHNIENKPLPAAHQELTHLQKQIIGTLESLNITDKAIQKELIVKKFGIDILERTSNAYKNRSDHKELINSFIPIDVHNASINILNTSHDYASVGQQFDTMAEQVFHNARLCKLDFIENIENHVIDSIHIIKAPQNDAQFVFNVTVVDHLLTDIQHKVDNIVEGKSTSYMQCIGRGSELFTRAIVKFIEGLNPITQVKSIGELIQGAGHLTSHIIQHPIDSLHTLRAINAKTCEFLVNTAIFTSDTIFGTTYLTPEEYQQRSSAFWKTVESIPAESIVDVVAQVAADFAVGKGVIKIFIYIKEIDAAIKIENYAAKVADKLKQAVDIHLTDNPIFVTAEGLVLKTSNDLKKFGETIKNSSIGQKVILRVNNMKEFFELPFGKTLIDNSQKTAQRFQHSPIYKITKDIPGTDLKKGYFYYLDRFHNDHIEVFDHAYKCINVYNLDGTTNTTKYLMAKQNGRNIKSIMKGK